MAVSSLNFVPAGSVAGPSRETERTGASNPSSSLEPVSQDRVALSTEAQNLQRIRQMAAELVGRLHPDLSPVEQLSHIAALEQAVCVRYGDRLAGELLPAEVLHGFMPFANPRR